MEYVAGGNMADYILKSILLKFGQFDRRDGLVMDEDEALYFFKQVRSRQWQRRQRIMRPLAGRPSASSCCPLTVDPSRLLAAAADGRAGAEEGAD
jgi:hypothetical protein